MDLTMEGGGQPSKHSNLEVAQPGLEYDRHSNAPHAILEGDGNASQVHMSIANTNAA